MGDEALFEASRRAFRRYRLVDAPYGSRFTKLARYAPVPVIAGGLLGGGTTVGRYRMYRRPFEAWFERYPQLPAFAFGVGVADPSFERRVAGVDPEPELRAWAEVLHRFAVVTVRGPDSHAVLDEAGIGSTIVGDPALLLEPPAGTAPRERLLGVNVGVSARESDIDWGSRLQEIIRAIRVLSARGWRIRLIPFHDSDLASSQAVARGSNGAVDVVDGWRSLPTLLGAIAECHALVGTKLHAVVLASAAGVPALSLAYEPKCWDFQRSLGREAFTLGLRDVRADAIVDRVDHIGDDRDRHSAEIGHAVEARRRSLSETISTIERKLR
jgi:polysaccharide pyruvyl transferase WcaK-like protein